MKKPYNVVGRRRSWFQLLIVCILMLSSGMGFAQTFTEALGTTATEGQDVETYESNLGFDNDNERGFTYVAIGATLPALSVTGVSPVSGGPNIQFAPSTNNSSFAVANISTAGITGPTLTFALSAPANTLGNTVTAINNRFRVQIGIGTVSSTGAISYVYNNAAYTFARTSGTWGNATVTLPGNTGGNALIAIRFQRVAAGNTNNEVYRVDDIVLGGTSTGVLTAQPTTLDFGDVSTGSNSAPQSIRVSGQDLTGNVTLTAPSGYQIRVQGSGTFGASLTLAATNGIVPSTRIQVRFVPVAAGTNNGALVVSSPGVPSVEVDLTGNGIVPVINANPTSLAFGSVFVGQTSAPLNITVSGTNVTNNVTVTAPTGFQVRRTAADAYASAVVLTAAEVTAGFTLQAAFRPATEGSFASSINVTTPGASTSVSVTGTATAAPSGAFINVNPTALDFNTVTTSGSSQTLSFTVFANNLTAPLVLTASSANISFRDATSGGAFTSGPITINPSNGTVDTRVIEVRLIRPVGSGLFSGTIVASSTGATSRTVTINGNNVSGATSDISVTNPNNTEFTFVARPNSFSRVLSYDVSATNLIQDLTIRPEGPNASFFQISLDGITFTSTLVIPRDASNNVLKRPIFIRFVPGNAATTVTALIRNSSAPADNGDLTVTGISEPTLRLSRAVGNFPDNVIRGTKSSPSTGNPPLRVIGLLLGSNVDLRVPADDGDVTRNPSGIPQFEFSLDGGTTYVQQATIPIDADGNIDQGLLVRYAPTRVGAASTNLEFRNSSFASGSYFNLPSGFGRTQGFAIAPVPTAQSTAVVTRSGATATVSFDLSNPPAGTSYGQSRLVIVSSTYATLPVGLQPQQKQNFDPGLTSNGSYVFGTGSSIGPNGSDTYVVFGGSGSTFSVSNLDPAKTYYFYSFEFNNDGLLNAENYRVPSNQPTQPIPLPVTLVSFSAKAKGSQVLLNWVTASELNNKGFEVQRSRDGRSFGTILTRDGKGTTSATTTYSEVDKKPLNGLSYYRLKQVDLDGSSSFSATVTVNFLNSGEVTMYPNPVQDQLTIDVAGSAEGATATITDMTGRLISTRKLGADSKLDMTNLQAGTYLVTVGEGDAKVTRRIVKK